MAATYVHHITIKTHDVNEEIKNKSKYKTIVIESPDTNEEMYEKMKSLLAFEKAVSTSFHLNIETTVKTYNHLPPEEIYQEYITAWSKEFSKG